MAFRFRHAGRSHGRAMSSSRKRRVIGDFACRARHAQPTMGDRRRNVAIDGYGHQSRMTPAGSLAGAVTTH